MHRWEVQQGRMSRREPMFRLIVDAVRTYCGDSPRILDLGCGPGSMGFRITQEIAGSRVVGVDTDPVLLALGRNALPRDGRISLVDADLGDPGLTRIGSDFDAAVTTTALHWLELAPLRQLYRSLAAMLKPRGIFLNGDNLEGTGSPLIDSFIIEMRGPDANDPRSGPGETWDQWWEAVMAEPALKEEVAERRRRNHDHPNHEETPGLLEHESALRRAGFAEVGTLWQHLDARVLVAIR